MKKTIFIVFAVCLVLTLSACSLIKLIPGETSPTTVDTKPDEEYLYTISKGEATITGIQPALTLNSTIVIPSTLGGFPVTSIGPRVFHACEKLTAVTIPDSVTTIAEQAFFSCGNLASVTMGNRVTSIGMEAFSRCNNLTAITIPNSVTSIGECAFCHCEKLSTITIPDSVTSIGKSAFANTGYESDNLNWENDVLYMGNHLITARNLTGAYTVKTGTKIIADGAFNQCKSLTAVTIPDSVTHIGREMLSDCSNLVSVTIGDGVKTIGDYAFFGCSGLTSVAMGNRVTNIGNSAFFGCSSLTSITIPNSMTSMKGNVVFGSCSSLTSIIVDENHTAYSVQDGVLFNKDKTTLLCYPAGKTNTAYTVPNGVTRIEQSAFLNCEDLISVTIPDSVTSIGVQAFYNTGYYKDKANWDNEALYIGHYLIDTKEIAGAYAIKPGTKVVADNAFYWQNVTSVSIPSSVVSIGEIAFSDCNRLVSFTVDENNTAYSTQDGVLFNKDKTTLVSYPVGKINAMYTIPDSVTTIADRAFSSCDNLVSITIGEGVKTIGREVFFYCTNLSNVWYVGSEADKSDIVIGDENTSLMCATWHYDACPVRTEHIYDNANDTSCNACGKLRKNG